jgi:hypothetical protein
VNDNKIENLNNFFFSTSVSSSFFSETLHMYTKANKNEEKKTVQCSVEARFRLLFSFLKTNLWQTFSSSLS